MYCVLRKAAANLRMDILSSFLELPATIGTSCAIVEIFELRLSRRCFSAMFRDARGLLNMAKMLLHLSADVDDFPCCSDYEEEPSAVNYVVDKILLQVELVELPGKKIRATSEYVLCSQKGGS